MTQMHISISFPTLTKAASEHVLKGLQELLAQFVMAGEIGEPEIESEKEVTGTIRIPEGCSPNAIPADLEFDDIFVPSAEDF